MTFRTTALMNQTPKIACLPHGPYYLLNDMTAAPVPNLRRANGEPCTTVRGVALCRCGGSRNKPFCDGSHSLIGFKDQRSANATPNRRKSYAGKRISIHDNRGICSHAGFCTDRLKSVFRMGEEPWIDADGASGAISIGLAIDEAIDGVVRRLSAKGVRFRGPVVRDEKAGIALAFFGDQ